MRSPHYGVCVCVLSLRCVFLPLQEISACMPINCLMFANGLSVGLRPPHPTLRKATKSFNTHPSLSVSCSLWPRPAHIHLHRTSGKLKTPSGLPQRTRTTQAAANGKREELAPASRLLARMSESNWTTPLFSERSQPLACLPFSRACRNVVSNAPPPPMNTLVIPTNMRTYMHGYDHYMTHIAYVG